MKLTLKSYGKIKRKTRRRNPQELADILEVILTICEYKNVSFSDIEKLRQKKKEKKGGFSKKIILEDIE
jgi:predicted house-cleaning noncanonical NTP pyrophosphatase (MazG superfamily)